MAVSRIHQPSRLIVITIGMSEASMRPQVQITSKVEKTDKKYNMADALSMVRTQIAEAWQVVAPFWPLQHVIACNPLQGLEDLDFETAVMKGSAFFRQKTFPSQMEDINRETIKWCQVFFDKQQATIAMPYRKQGLYRAWRALACFDARLRKTKNASPSWINALPASAEETIIYCLAELGIAHQKRVLFLTLLLTTLSGWAGYVKYHAEWKHNEDADAHPVSMADYLAVRIAITCLLWRDAHQLLTWHEAANTDFELSPIEKMIATEEAYRTPLLHRLSRQVEGTPSSERTAPIAQWIFCIDVRSEPFRRALEAQGGYETYGLAGFFGLPVQIKNDLSEKSYSSCPVLLKPAHTVLEKPACSDQVVRKIHRGKKQLMRMKRLYQSLKYTFSTPFPLAEMLGPWSGLWMFLKTMAPVQAAWAKNKVIHCLQPASVSKPLLDIQDEKMGIGFRDQCLYAENALRMTGLTRHFANVVVLCGHGSQTENNAYATALDCGACGGHHGESNAKILACILNDKRVRRYLDEQGICIPAQTAFIAASHNTTTDEVILFPEINATAQTLPLVSQLNKALKAARFINSQWRCKQMGSRNGNTVKKAAYHVKRRGLDWSQTRPEWGLARNAAFIIAPRPLTADLDLEGRSFLHSYDWRQDENGVSLTTILMGPMLVTQWINSQYLFSLLDNVAYGSGSKITHNITGKIGVMQGNGSDLMHGLPLQSLYDQDHNPYHQHVRLMTVISAPRQLISAILSRQPTLKKLFSNGWVMGVCLDPEDAGVYCLNRDLTWVKRSFETNGFTG